MIKLIDAKVQQVDVATKFNVSTYNDTEHDLQESREDSWVESGLHRQKTLQIDQQRKSRQFLSTSDLT